jgi:hypothetical protein
MGVGMEITVSEWKEALEREEASAKEARAGNRRRTPKQQSLPGLGRARMAYTAISPPSEHQEQAFVCAWLTGQRVTFCAVPNGAYLFGDSGSRARQWKKLQEAGCKPGVPDLLLFSPPSGEATGWRGCAVEMKREKGGVVSPEQVAWLDALEALGWKVIVAHGADEAIRRLREIGYGR